MDFVISENQKKLIKDSAKKKLELEIYSAAIVAGIDPESLELSNGKSSTTAVGQVKFDGQY